MTWAEWCDRDYNTLNLYYDDGSVWHPSMAIRVIFNGNAKYVFPDDVIIANGDYSFA